MKTASAAALFCSLGGIAACTPYRLISPQQTGNRLQVAKSTFQGDPFVLVSHPSEDAPIFLVRDEESDSYLAILLECTHRQCTVNPEGEELQCPCHGSRFDRQGKVVEGPAKRDLPAYPVASDAENIYIEIE